MKKRKVKSRSKSRPKSSISKLRFVFLLIFILLIYMFVQGDNGFLKYLELRREKHRLLKKIEELKKENKLLQSEIDLLTNNYRYIEKMARERHQMGKEDEKIYIINPPRE
jgi:cell division protein FtsB